MVAAAGRTPDRAGRLRRRRSRRREKWLRVPRVLPVHSPEQAIKSSARLSASAQNGIVLQFCVEALPCQDAASPSRRIGKGIVLEARSWDVRDGRFHRWLDQLSPIAELVTLHDRPWNQHATWMRADNLRRDSVSPAARRSHRGLTAWSKSLLDASVTALHTSVRTLRCGHGGRCCSPVESGRGCDRQ
jgi:hypothetical protein